MSEAQSQLRSFVERIERLEEDKSTVGADIRDVYGEAKGVGFDVKAIRQIIRLRKKSKDERHNEEHILDLYKTTLGME